MKKWNKKRIMASILALLLAFLMVFSVVFGLFGTDASAASQASVDSLKNKLNDIAKKKDSIENQLKDIKTDKRTVNAKKVALDAQIEVAQDEIDTTNELIAELSGLITKKETELFAKEAEEQSQYELFKKRVRVMYENGETGYLGILLSTDDFSTMLSRYEIISQIIDYDKRLIQQINEKIAEIEAAKASLQSDKHENETLKTSLVQKSASLKAKSDESQQMMEQLEQNEEEYKKAYEEYEKEEAKIQKQIAAELAKTIRRLCRRNFSLALSGAHNHHFPIRLEVSSDSACEQTAYGSRYQRVYRHKSGCSEQRNDCYIRIQFSIRELHYHQPWRRESHTVCSFVKASGPKREFCKKRPANWAVRFYRIFDRATSAL